MVGEHLSHIVLIVLLVQHANEQLALWREGKTVNCLVLHTR
jgi:hypothetical protein